MERLQKATGKKFEAGKRKAVNSYKESLELFTA
jgi:hypothetical protein